MRYYFMGICGTAMGNVALMLKTLGHEVSGTDTGIYPPMSQELRNSDIKTYEGYDAKRLEAISPDKVIVGNVISRGNEEIEWLLESKMIPYCSLPELLRTEVLSGRHNIVVTGTHGKTTTTALIAHLLKSEGIDPGYLIGGVPKNLPTGSYPGKPGSPFVIEGDEYDSAFFDKRSKFIHYLPSILVINNIEFDHADIFRDLQDIQRSFNHLLRIVPRNGCVLVNGDDPNIQALLPISWTKVLRVGEGELNDLRIVDFEENRERSSFTLVWQGKLWARVSSQSPGKYNARNAAMAALSAGLTLHPENPCKFQLDALSDFKGVKRRQEVILEKENLIVIEDFAHHPTALRETITALQKRYTDYKLTACFEPRSNTACRRFHQETFREALKNADQVMLGAIHRPEIYSDENRLDIERIARELNHEGIKASAHHSNEKLLEQLHQDCKKNLSNKQLICFFSNGSFSGIIPKFVERAEKF